MRQPTSEPHQLSLLGRFEVIARAESLDLPNPSQRLLALLALENGYPLPRSHVAGTLWPEASEQAARSNLRSALWKLGPQRDSLIAATTHSLRLKPDVWVDLHERRAWARRILDPAWNGVPPSAQLFADDLLPDWSDVWVEPERESYRQLRLHTLETLSGRLTKANRFGEAVEVGLMAVASAPLRESAHRVVIQALLAEGNRGEAVRSYQHLVDLLRDELHVKPSFSLEDLLDAEAS